MDGVYIIIQSVNFLSLYDPNRYELKRAQWRNTINNDNEGDAANDEEEAELKAIMEGTGLQSRREASDKTMQPHDANSRTTPAPRVASLAREVASPFSKSSSKLTSSATSKAEMEDEIFVMDAVQGILSKSR